MSTNRQIEEVSRLIQKKYEKNIEFFKAYMPSIHRLIEENPYELSLTFDSLTNRLERTTEQGEKYYPDGAVNYALSEVKNFEEKMSQTDYRPNPSLIHPNHLIKKKAFYKTSEKYIHSYVKDRKIKPVHSGLVIFGMGMGYHIEILCNKDTCHHYTVIEPNIKRFQESLYCIDWQAILTSLKSHKQLTIMVKDPKISFDEFCTTIQHQCYKLFPSITVSTLIYSHDHVRNEESFEAIRKTIKEFNNIARVATERAGPDCQRLLNTNENCRRNNKLINLDETFIENEGDNIAIIGAGPSLDDYIDIIKKYRNKMIIVSAGSSIKSLIKNDIKPDIHFELEFLNLATRLLNHTNEEYDLSEVDLLCSAESNPGFLNLFKSARMCVQETSEISRIVKSEYILKRGGLTCTNGATALFSRLCDNDIYLFGLDFAHTHGEHHAKDNITNDEDVPDDLSVLKQTGLELKSGVLIETEGVNGETLSTTPALYSARLLLEALCKTNRNNYFNCSNGANINGTQHTTKSELENILENTKDNKKEINYKELILSPALVHNHSKEVFDTSFNISRQLLEEIKSLKDASQIDICLKISQFIKRIIDYFNHASGQFRNIMGFNRTPLLLLYSVINYSTEEEFQEILQLWIDEYSDFIKYTSEIIYKKFEDNNFMVEEDWLDNH